VLLPFEKISPHEKELREYFARFDVPADTTPLGQPVCIMLFTNRSGSSLVSEHMRSTPHFTGFGEPLNYRWVIDRSEQEGLTSFADYLRFESDRLYRHKPGALLGLKASYGQAMMLMRSGAVPGFFDDVRWVVIQRDDLLSQAVSFAIADQTKQWHSFDSGEPVDPVYDYEDIRRRLQGFAHSYMAINSFCASFDIRPYRIIYDEFARDPKAGTSNLAAYLGVADVSIDADSLQMERQRNRFSAQFRRQFISDYQSRMRSTGTPGGEGQLG
jgi:LPS sulfotransferase NodH